MSTKDLTAEQKEYIQFLVDEGFEDEEIIKLIEAHKRPTWNTDEAGPGDTDDKHDNDPPEAKKKSLKKRVTDAVSKVKEKAEDIKDKLKKESNEITFDEYKRFHQMNPVIEKVRNSIPIINHAAFDKAINEALEFEFETGKDSKLKGILSRPDIV